MQVNGAAYTSLVRLTMEYASASAVQKASSRVRKSRYRQPVSSMEIDPDCETL